MKQSDNLLFIVSIVIFGIFAVAGVLAFSFIRGESSEAEEDVQINDLIVWGTLPAEYIVPPLNNASIPGFSLSNNAIKYEQMTLSEFNTRFVNDLASGTGPDLIFMPHENILEQYSANRILYIPYEAYPKVQFQNTFIDAATIFLDQNGVIAVPALADPMVLYYNKTTANRKFIRVLPERWEDLLQSIHVIEKNTLGNISKALISLGAIDNYDHTKELVSLLQYQSVRNNPQTDYNLYNSNFAEIIGTPGSEEALSFYKRFAETYQEEYTWNESLLNAQNMFANGDLLFYPGFVSERNTISRLNSTLRFGTIPMLYETGEDTSQSTFVRLYAFALPTTTRYPNFLLQAIGQASVYQTEWINDGLPPALRQPLQPDPSQDATERIILDAVFTGIAWNDILPQRTSDIYRDAVRRLILNTDSPESVTNFIQNRVGSI